MNIGSRDLHLQRNNKLLQDNIKEGMCSRVHPAAVEPGATLLGGGRLLLRRRLLLQCDHRGIRGEYIVEVVVELQRSLLKK